MVGFLGVADEWIVETHLAIRGSVDGKIGMQKNSVVIAVLQPRW